MAVVMLLAAMPDRVARRRYSDSSSASWSSAAAGAMSWADRPGSRNSNTRIDPRSGKSNALKRATEFALTAKHQGSVVRASRHPTMVARRGFPGDRHSGPKHVGLSGDEITA